MEPKTLIKHLWIKYDGDSKAILDAVKDKKDLPVSDTEAEEVKRKVAKFDSDYDSLVITDDEFQEKLQPRLNEYAPGMQPPFLIRWNRTETLVVRRRIMDEFDHNVFILDGNLAKYNISEKVNGFGYVYNSETESYQIYHTHLSAPILTTKSFEEVRNFALFTCKFLLIGGKSDELNVLFKTQMLQLYMNGGTTCRVMAVPGKPKCFANQCLKTIPEVMFIDCWDDVDTIVHKKEEE